MYKKIRQALHFLHDKTGAFKPEFGIILGTGLSNLEKKMEILLEIPYAEIPHFAVSTVQSHTGKLLFAYWQGIAVVAMAGRLHYYEGYSMEQVTFPIRVLKYLSIKRLFISNAAGGLQKHLYPGDLVFIKDHINLHAQNPLRGANDPRLGPRFVDMLNAYDRALNQQALEIAKKTQYSRL